MGKLFDEYKKEIIKYPKELAYLNHEKYDSNKLHDLFRKIYKNQNNNREDPKAICDFIKISDCIHNMYNDIYEIINESLCHLNLKGCEIVEYIVALINLLYKNICNKQKEAIKKSPKDVCFLLDMMNFKIESAKPEVGLIDARSALENYTDSISLILNYLRHNFEKDFINNNSKPEEFIDRITHCINNCQAVTARKYSYDDILYNGGFVNIDTNKKIITFDYESHEELKLLLAGKMMFYETLYSKINNQKYQEKDTKRFLKNISNHRIKNVKVNESYITMDFGRGIPKEHQEIVIEMQSFVDSYYEFLDGDTILTELKDSTIDEVISVWCAIKYISLHTLFCVNYNVPIKTRRDFNSVPSKILKKDLVDYIIKLITIKPVKIKAIVSALEADWGKFNDIWTSMLYPIKDQYAMPFYPIINSSPYNVIDQLLLKGGFNLDKRGKQFEDFLHNQLTHKRNSFPITCISSEKYGEKGREEEIDILILMKNVILVAEAKCIHYSMEPRNYAEALERLKDGCKQAIRKSEFIENNPQYFSKFGDYSSKKIIPFVITNYPTFTGFSHEGVYIIDSHSFLSYMQSGTIVLKEFTSKNNLPLWEKRFYNNEDEYSDNFINYLKKNPLKEELLKRIYIHDLPLSTNDEPWSIIIKSAQLKSDPTFNIKQF